MRPNFLIIQCDDLGVDDIGWNNAAVHTPNIDKLAAESVRFTDFTVNPVCAPSRAAFLTGRHFLRTGVSHVHGGKDFLHLDERTLAEQFGAAGYATGMWGKWHLGCSEGYFPWQRGFDEAWMAQLYRHRDSRGSLNGEDVETGKWADAAMADYAIDFVRRHRDQPFFAYLPTMTPHGPLDAPEDWVGFYRGRGHSEALSKLWGMVSALDEQVGRILGVIDEVGLRERTLVVFMSDNGPAIEMSALSDDDRARRRVSGLRGWKGDLYENGVRSPLFLRWSGRLEAGGIGAAVDGVDLAPTLLDMAAVGVMPDTLLMDGRSIYGELLGGQGVGSDEAAIYNYAHRGWLTSGPPYSLDGLPGEYAPVSVEERGRLDVERQSLSIRRGRYKFLLNPDFQECDAGPSRVLVDLHSDPGEAHNVIAEHPALATRLEQELRTWWAEITNSPHAFSAPCFILKFGTNQIPARAPCALRGSVFNQVVELRGWAQPGDAAVYALHLSHPSPPSYSSEATITFSWAHNEAPTAARWTLRVPETGASAQTNGITPVRIVLPAGRFRLELELAQLNNAVTIPPLRALEIEIKEVSGIETPSGSRS